MEATRAEVDVEVGSDGAGIRSGEVVRETELDIKVDGLRGGTEIETALLVLSLFNASERPARATEVSSEIPSLVPEATDAERRLEGYDEGWFEKEARGSGSETTRGVIVKRGIEDGGKSDIDSLEDPGGRRILLVGADEAPGIEYAGARGGRPVPNAEGYRCFGRSLVLMMPPTAEAEVVPVLRIDGKPLPSTDAPRFEPMVDGNADGGGMLLLLWVLTESNEIDDKVDEGGADERGVRVADGIRLGGRLEADCLGKRASGRSGSTIGF